MCYGFSKDKKKFGVQGRIKGLEGCINSLKFSHHKASDLVQKQHSQLLLAATHSKEERMGRWHVQKSTKTGISIIRKRQEIWNLINNFNYRQSALVLSGTWTDWGAFCQFKILFCQTANLSRGSWVVQTSFFLSRLFCKQALSVISLFKVAAQNFASH